MGNLLFSPSGRIGPAAYFKGMMIIAVAGAVLNLVTYFSPALGTILGLLGLVFLYCFFAMTIKRSHDAGKSGWMSIVWFILLLIISGVIGFALSSVFGVSMMDAFNPEIAADPEAVMELTRKSALPGAISSIVSYAIGAYVINMLNKSDPGDNQFGPATVGDS